MLTANPTTTGLNDFRAILKELNGSPEEVAVRARREAAILAFGRRTSAQPQVALLMQDAGALLTEVLEADLNGVAETLSQNTLSLTISGGEEYGKLARPMVYKGAFDPTTSMAAYTMNAAEPVVSESLAHDPRFTDLFLRRVDAVSGLCVPLHASDKVFGALGVYQKRTRQFTEEDVRFTEIICHLLSASLARVAIEEERRMERCVTQTVLETVESYVVQLDWEGKVVEVNRAYRNVTGFSIANLAGRPFWISVVSPEDASLVQKIVQGGLSERKPCEFESRILARGGPPRQVSWSMNVLCDTTGRTRMLVLAGTDRSEQLRCEEELRTARNQADKATQALVQMRAKIGEATSGVEDELLDTMNVDRVAGPPVETGLRLRPAVDTSGMDLRSSPRRNFQYRQKVAPVRGKELPTRKDFFEVECHDISAGGISFFLSEQPDFSNLIVALGVPPFESFFAARVVRVVVSDRDGSIRYLVGCRFTGRVHM